MGGADRSGRGGQSKLHAAVCSAGLVPASCACLSICTGRLSTSPQLSESRGGGRPPGSARAPRSPRHICCHAIASQKKSRPRESLLLTSSHDNKLIWGRSTGAKHQEPRAPLVYKVYRADVVQSTQNKRKATTSSPVHKNESKCSCTQGDYAHKNTNISNVPTVLRPHLWIVAFPSSGRMTPKADFQPGLMC